MDVEEDDEHLSACRSTEEIEALTVFFLSFCFAFGSSFTSVYCNVMTIVASRSIPSLATCNDYFGCSRSGHSSRASWRFQGASVRAAKPGLDAFQLRSPTRPSQSRGRSISACPAILLLLWGHQPLCRSCRPQHDDAVLRKRTMHDCSAPDVVQAEGMPAFAMVWPTLQGFAAAADAAEQAALANCVARMVALPAVPSARVTDAVLPLILSRLCASSASDQVQLTGYAMGRGEVCKSSAVIALPCRDKGLVVGLARES